MMPQSTQSSRFIQKRALVAFVLLAMVPLSTSQAGSARGELEAQFVSRIARYVDWPEGSFAGQDDPIRVGALGEDAFVDGLISHLAQSTAGARGFETIQLAGIEDAETVHIIVVAKSGRSTLRKIARQLKGKAVLSIAPSFTFAENGGILGMEIYRGKIAFEVNNRAAREADLRISSRVLRLASTVY
jgi:hypothetical protein